MRNDAKLEKLVRRLLPKARTMNVVLLIVSIVAIIAAVYGLAGKAKAEEYLHDSERRVEDLERQLGVFRHADGALGAPQLELVQPAEIPASRQKGN